MTVKDLIEFYGSANRAALNLDITRQTMYNWSKTGIPKIFQDAVAWRTKGKLKPDGN